MSEEWLDIQSFFADRDVLSAVNDLSVAIKLELAKIDDADRVQRAEKARDTLRQFLTRLDEVESADENEVVSGMDPRFKELTDAYACARRDGANFRSVLMRTGARNTLKLLEATDPRAKRELLDCLDELRRVVSRHQQTDISAIIEDF
jgi:ribosomal protein L31E